MLKLIDKVIFLILFTFSVPAFSQVIIPEKIKIDRTKLKQIKPSEPMIEYRTVSQQEMDAWPIDKKRSGEKLWAETTWGGDTPEYKKTFNWNIWPNRVVFTVDKAGDVARGEVFWRRSALSVRMKGLKIISAKTGEEIKDAGLIEYGQEKIVIDFRPVSGPGTYYLYYAAAEDVLFSPSKEWLEKEKNQKPVIAKAERIEARCAIDSFYPMETIPLKKELESFLAMFPDVPYLVFPQDRDNSIKMQFEIPFLWVFRDPRKNFVIEADKNEYRVFQLGIWACRENIPDVKITFSDFKGSGNNLIPSKLFQCLTLTSNIKSKYIIKPSGPFPVPKGQVRALWCGVNLPENISPGKYKGYVEIVPENGSPAKVPVTLVVSKKVVEQKGDNDLWRLSRLRWLESDIGLSDEIFPPYKPLVLSKSARTISTWGHSVSLNEFGLTEKINYGANDILAAPVKLNYGAGISDIKWENPECIFSEISGSRIDWHGEAVNGALKLIVDGSIEFDGCISMTVALESDKKNNVENLTFNIGWNKENAQLAAGMGYRGKRDKDRIWRSIARERGCFDPSLWLGSVKAGLGFITWETSPWENPARMDAATVSEKDNSVVMQLNLGSHEIAPGKPWKMQYALRPTPVKPVDLRHWQFRYLHRGGGFMPGNDDTPQSYLKDNCKRLDELAGLGVKRLNLHDWWGPAFNYAWQWDGPDNLLRLTKEAHKRGIKVKVYNSGRELSSFAPEFLGLVYIGTRFSFPDSIKQNPKGIFQDAWHENHLSDGLPQGWPRIHQDLGNEHAVPVSNATRNGNFYLESMRYMTENFGTDGAYWDGADGPTLGHREMAKRLWTIFRKTNPDAVVDAHHGTTLLESAMTSYMLCLPFIDSIWHGEGFPYDVYDPWEWLVEISGIPFGIPSEMLSGEQYIDRGMLFGIWPRMGWGAGTEKQRKLWSFFDTYGIDKSEMLGWWEEKNGVTIDRPNIYVTAYKHPSNGVFLVIASWHPPLQNWVGGSIDVSLDLDRKFLGLPDSVLIVTDIMNGENIDTFKPVVLKKPKEDIKSQFYEYRSLVSPFEGRLIWVRGK